MMRADATKISNAEIWFRLEESAKNQGKRITKLFLLYKTALLGRGGGQMVSVLAFYSDVPSSNPTEAYRYFYKILCWKEQK